MKEEQIPLVYVTAISTLFVSLNLLTIFVLLSHYGIVTFVITKYMTLTLSIVVALVNYFIFVRPRKFLDHNFNENVRGGILITAYFIVSVVSFIIVANQHRNKVLNNLTLGNMGIQVRLSEWHAI